MIAKLLKNTDIALAVGVFAILALLLLPVPPALLDVLLAINITLSLIILFSSLYISTPLDLTIFPGLLLITTLYRLGLNISSTRLILLEAEAGKIIEGFGTFVVGGNYVVGFIIFIILTVINFVVILKGSGRIAEVAARFALDSMPGKQMAVDADLNSGLITEAEARERREAIRQEGEFYGAMDGASKFVKGDAIAGLVITAINIIAGFIIGIAQKNMEFIQALQTYTILTIGDGLVSQIPSLIISVSAGFLVTKSANKTSLDSQLKTQLLANPRVLGVVSGASFTFALLPGFPFLPFAFISTGLGFLSYLTYKQQQAIKAAPELEQPIEEPKEDRIENYLQVDPIEIEIGYGLISLVDESQGGTLFNKIASTRKFIALEYGVVVPPIRVRDNLQLLPNQYLFKIKGNVVANYEIYPDRYLAMNPGNIDEPLSGIQTKDPAFGLDAYWITPQEKEKADLLGYTVVDSTSVLSTHLQEIIKKNFDKILTRQAVKQLLENLKNDYPVLIDEINPELLPLGTIQRVLQNLLKEQIPIKDLVLILEALIDYSKVTKNVDVLTEYVRHSLGDTIANLFKDNNNVIHAYALGGDLENYVTRALQTNKDATQTLGLTPAMLQDLNFQLQDAQMQFQNLGYIPVIITSATIRPYFYKLINSSFPDFFVLSYTELPANVDIEFIGKIEVNYGN